MGDTKMMTESPEKELERTAIPAAKKISSGITYETRVITPEEARKLLDTVEHAPPLDKRAFNHYTSVMKKKGWLENGLPIILDKNGRLLAGYHRLSACIEADTPFTTMVARGANPNTLHTIDQHRRRTYTSVLEANGIANAGDVHRTLTKMIRIENGAFKIYDLPISWSRLDIVLDSNPEIV